MNRNQIILELDQLIEKHKCGIDGYFFDTKGAARDILSYLEDQGVVCVPTFSLPQREENQKAA